MSVRERPIRPTLSFDPALLLRAQDVRAAIFDVDGVLTDGQLYIGEHGESFKAFNTLDGHGLKLLARAGVEPIVITGRDSPAVRRRVNDLGLRHAAYGVHDKVAAAEPLLAALGLGWHELAVIGDDWPDLPLMQLAAFSVAPPNAHDEVRAHVDHVTTRAGGQGAVREFCDLLMIARGRYAELLQGHLVALDTTAGETAIGDAAADAAAR